MATLKADRESSSACHSCRARVIWCLFPDGRMRPVEEFPTLTGNIAVIPSLFGGQKIEARRVSTSTHYKLHNDVCPQRQRWSDRTYRRQMDSLLKTAADK